MMRILRQGGEKKFCEFSRRGKSTFSSSNRTKQNKSNVLIQEKESQTISNLKREWEREKGKIREPGD